MCGCPDVPDDVILKGLVNVRRGHPKLHQSTSVTRHFCSPPAA